MTAFDPFRSFSSILLKPSGTMVRMLGRVPLSMRLFVLAACLAAIACTDKSASLDNWADLCAIRRCDELRQNHSYAEIDGAVYELPGAGSGWPSGGQTFVQLNTSGRSVGYYHLAASSLMISRPLYADITRGLNGENDAYNSVRIDMQSSATKLAYSEVDRITQRIEQSSTVRWNDDFLMLTESNSVYDPGTDTRKVALVSQRPLAFGRRAYVECDTFCNVQLLRSASSSDDWPVIEIRGFRVTALPNCETEPTGCLSQRELISRIPSRLATLEANLRAIRRP
jgi:hypothetical protein